MIGAIDNLNFKSKNFNSYRINSNLHFKEFRKSGVIRFGLII